jgi:hypothetical protein
MGTSSSDMGNDTMVMMGPFSTQWVLFETDFHH